MPVSRSAIALLLLIFLAASAVHAETPAAENTWYADSVAQAQKLHLDYLALLAKVDRTIASDEKRLAQLTTTIKKKQADRKTAAQRYGNDHRTVKILDEIIELTAVEREAVGENIAKHIDIRIATAQKLEDLQELLAFLHGPQFFPGDLPVQPEPAATARHIVRTLPASDGKITKELLDKWIAQLMPMVEQVAGRKYKKTPPIKIVDRNEMFKVVATNTILAYRERDDGLTEDQIKQMAIQQAYTLAPAVLGLYGYYDKTLYIVPANLTMLLSTGDYTAKEHDQIAQIIVAHELLHTLQDQTIGLNAFFKKAGLGDEHSAFTSLVEGHAMAVQDRVAKKIGAGEAASKFSRLMAAGAAPIDDPAMELRNRALSTYFAQVYLTGQRFVEARGKDDFSKVWDLYESPPRATVEIVNPSRYGKINKPDIDYAAIVAAVKPSLENVPFDAEQNLTFGAYKFGTTLSLADPETRDKVIATLEHCQVLILQNPKKGLTVTASFWAMQDAPAAKTAMAAMQQQYDGTRKRLDAGQQTKTTGYKVQPITDLTADATVYETYKIGNIFAGLPVTQCRARRGKYVIDIQAMGPKIDKKRAADLIEAAFTKHAELLKNPTE